MSDVSSTGERKIIEVREEEEIQIIEEQETSDQENKYEEEPEVCFVNI